jgi:hypothetical protein
MGAQMSLNLPSMSDALHLERIEKRVEETYCRIKLIEERQSKIIRLQTFAPEPYEMLKEINVLIEQDGEDNYRASFVDANVNASGCNEFEAVEGLKELLLSRYEFLNTTLPEKLGPGPKKQIAILREFIRGKQ